MLIRTQMCDLGMLIRTQMCEQGMLIHTQMCEQAMLKRSLMHHTQHVQARSKKPHMFSAKDMQVNQVRKWEIRGQRKRKYVGEALTV